MTCLTSYLYYFRRLSLTAKNPCTSVRGCSHVCFTGSSGRATCACYANFELQSDGKTCKGIFKIFYSLNISGTKMMKMAS